MKSYKLSADALTCEQLNKNGVRNSAVNYAGLFNSTSHSLNAAVNFRYHTTADNALSLHKGDFAYLNGGDKSVAVVLVFEQSHDIGHKDKIFSLKLCGNS